MLIISHCILMSLPTKRNETNEEARRDAASWGKARQGRHNTAKDNKPAQRFWLWLSFPFPLLATPQCLSACVYVCARLCLFEFCHLAATLNDAAQLLLSAPDTCSYLSCSFKPTSKPPKLPANHPSSHPFCTTTHLTNHPPPPTQSEPNKNRKHSQ